MQQGNMLQKGCQFGFLLRKNYYSKTPLLTVNFIITVRKINIMSDNVPEYDI